MLVIGSIFFFENYSVIFTVRDGQVNLITMLLVVLAWVSMKAKKSEILTAGLIIILFKERRKEKKEENKNDLSNY
jgi:hypothetical protein